MKRLDVLLTEKGLVPSRTKAKELIQAGAVLLKSGSEWRAVTNPSHKFNEEELPAENIRVEKHNITRFVSRAGLKLEGALKHTHLDVTGFRTLDVGQSTGGFTDCLLQFGVWSVVGIDVGREQLAEALWHDPRVTAFEGLNARELKQSCEFLQEADQGFDLVVMDVSFISIMQVLPDVIEYLKPQGRLLSLVKPQFELGSQALNKKGVVKDSSLYNELERRVRQHVQYTGCEVLDYFQSSLLGQEGNREFFVYARKKGEKT